MNELKVLLPPPTKYRRQQKPDGGYEMVPAYTHAEVVKIIKTREESNERKRREAYRQGYAAGIRKMGSHIAGALG